MHASGQEEDAIRGRIKTNLNTLAFTKIKEQYTQEEMASFEKPKKKRKKVGRKKERINWDEEEAKAIGEAPPPTSRPAPHPH